MRASRLIRWRAVLIAWLLAFVVIAPVVFAYFLIIKGTDRYEPEPFWLLTLTFFWGAIVATVSAIVGNAIGLGAMSWALDAGAADPLVQASTASFVAPLVEETTKGAGLLLLWAASSLFLHELDGPLDGAIYGGVIGLGFTLTEDVMYVSKAAVEHGGAGLLAVFVLRTLAAGLSHASFTAMTGLGIGIAAEASSALVKVVAPFGGWCAAVGLHFVHNFLVTFWLGEGEGLGIKLLAFWVFDGLFFVIIVLLAIRDRAIVLRGLVDEAGRLLHPLELHRTASYWMLVPFWNLLSLASSPGGYSRSRKKQLDLVKLAFVKHRRRRGKSFDLDQREQRLRARIEAANHAGVFIGPR